MKIANLLDHPGLNQLRLEMGAAMVSAPPRGWSPRYLDAEMVRNLGKPLPATMPVVTGAPPPLAPPALAPVPTMYQRAGNSRVLDPVPPKDGKPWAKSQAEYEAVEAKRRAVSVNPAPAVPAMPVAAPSETVATQSSSPISQRTAAPARPQARPPASPAPSVGGLFSQPLVYGEASETPAAAPASAPASASPRPSPAHPDPTTAGVKPSRRRNQAILDRLKNNS